MSEDVEGSVKFCIEFTAGDMRNWSPEQIRHFFAGLARLVAARGLNIPGLIAEIDKVKGEADAVLARLDARVAEILATTAPPEPDPIADHKLFIGEDATPSTVGRAQSRAPGRAPQGAADLEADP